jgi:site-specific recombinase XerD
MLAAGADIKVVSEPLCHSSIRITYDLYSHLLPTAQKDAADRLESLLKSNSGTKPGMSHLGAKIS